MNDKFDMSEEVLGIVVDGLDKEEYHDLDKYYGVDETSKLTKSVLRNKYLAPWENSVFDMWLRLAWGASEAESAEDRPEMARKFFSILRDFYFLPGGRINYGLGRKDIKVSFSNCYVIPIKNDSLEAIYDCVKESAMTYKVGGGVGIDLSILRPKNDPILGTGGNSCGSVGFMELFSVNTNTVSQQNRRGALMLTMDVSHPDIESFINIKNDVKAEMEVLNKLIQYYPSSEDDLKILKDRIEKKRSVQHANISVKLSDEFLEAVENDSMFDLKWGGKVYKTIKAKDLWDNIVKNAWESAEPGLIFWDRMKETNNLEYINPLLSTNPCSELPLGPYGNCLLGHMNLVKFVENGRFNFDKFKEFVGIGVRFLDNVLTLNNGRHALKEQNEIALNERRIGLGITGLGDALILMKLKYGSSFETVNFIEKVMETFRNAAYNASCDLGVEKGSFPWFDYDKFSQSKFFKKLPDNLKIKIGSGIRNGMLLTCAPVGTGSIIAETTSGIEPIFRVYLKRKVKNGENNEFEEFKVFHPLIAKEFPGQTEYPDYVVDSTQVSPEQRVRVQALIQNYIDNSISSTVNLPNSASEEDVSTVYLSAWKLGCKGITVYREGSREGVLVSLDKKEKASSKMEQQHFSAVKRPIVLVGETHKKKIDITNKQPYNCYITVNFEPSTRKPYELFVTETNSEKDVKDLMMLETTTRLISLLLRHNVPLKFIVQQLEKIKSQYFFSLPISIAGILKNYIGDDEGFELCPECGEYGLHRENGCVMCSECGFSKCS